MPTPPSSLVPEPIDELQMALLHREPAEDMAQCFKESKVEDGLQVEECAAEEVQKSPG